MDTLPFSAAPRMRLAQLGLGTPHGTCLRSECQLAGEGPAASYWGHPDEMCAQKVIKAQRAGGEAQQGVAGTGSEPRRAGGAGQAI